MCCGLSRLQGGESILRRVTWCAGHIIGDSVGWWSVRIYQGALSCLFSGQETAELEDAAIDQRSVSREVATLRYWLSVMVKTCDSEERDNAVNCYPLHQL